MFISWWKILIKLLQWPCNEPLNALRATPTRKRNCLKTSFPLPRQKKINHQVAGSDEGRIALHSLDEIYVFRLAIFLFYKKLNEYQEVAHWEVDIATCGVVFRKSVPQAWTGTGVQARCQDMTLNYKARQQERNGKINWERQTYLPSKNQFGRQAVIEVLSQVYWVVLMGNGRIFQWFAQKAS